MPNRWQVFRERHAAAATSIVAGVVWPVGEAWAAVDHAFQDASRRHLSHLLDLGADRLYVAAHLGQLFAVHQRVEEGACTLDVLVSQNGSVVLELASRVADQSVERLPASPLVPSGACMANEITSRALPPS